MIREYDLKKMTNEKAEVLAKLLDQESGPALSLSKARKEFPTLDLDPKVFEVIAQEAKTRKKSFTLSDYLETLDPSENHKPILHNGRMIFTDAFERQLMVRDLIVSGPNAVECGAFFSNTTNRTLFPEFINRNILAGRLMSEIDVTVDDLIAGTIEVDAITYRNITAEFGDDDLHQATIGEGARFPEILLTLGDRDITLQKFGGKVRGTYEFFRRVRANQFALILKMIGMQWEQDQANFALDVIINGNTGNSNPAVNTNTAVDDTMIYEDLVRWILGFRPFSSTLLVVNETKAGDILLMDEFMDPQAGFNFQATGSMISPFNRSMKISDSDLLDDLIVGVDSRFAVEKVAESGSSITESQKIMDGQFDEVFFSQYIGFAKMFEDASQTLTIDWA